MNFLNKIINYFFSIEEKQAKISLEYYENIEFRKPPRRGQ